jgi:hypothetical protein
MDTAKKVLKIIIISLGCNFLDAPPKIPKAAKFNIKNSGVAGCDITRGIIEKKSKTRTLRSVFLKTK